MKNFPINSTSVITPRIARLGRVLRRANVAEVIARGGVFNCRKTSGTNLWSAHARGDALDLFPPKSGEATIERIGRAVVDHATKKTPANLGRPVSGIVYVIFNRTKWIRGEGFSPYTGTPHVGHVHAAGSFSTTQVPPCAR